MTVTSDPGDLLRHLLAPPVFTDDALTARAGMFRTVGVSTLLLIATVIPVVMVVQPQAFWNGILVIGVGAPLVLATLALNRVGRTTLASWIYIGVILAILTINSLAAGGIRSPGVQAFFIFVMLAGLLVGERAGIMTALVCAAIGLGLVGLERLGVLAPTQLYGPVALWLLTCVYIGVALVTMRLATSTIRGALARAEAELSVREATQLRLTHALEAGEIGSFEYDPATDRFVADARALAITGLAADASGFVSYADWRRIVHPADLERVEGDLRSLGVGSSHARDQYRVIRDDGAERIVEVVRSATTDGSERPQESVGLIIDVTERKLAERERESLVKRLGERVKELRLLHDASTLLRRHRRVDLAILEELVAMMPGAWLHVDACRVKISYAEMVVASPGWRQTPWRLSSGFNTAAGPGSIDVVYLSEFPTRDEGPFLREERELIDSVAELLRSSIEEHDAERRRRGLETQLRQAQKMDALGTLAGGIAHDFNNILTAIGGNAEIALSEAPAGSAVSASLAEIVRAQDRARDLVKRILLFSRKQEAERKVIALSLVVEEALQLLRASLPPNIRIEPETQEALPPVLADATQMHQVIMNLGTNAGYAMRESGGTLTVKLEVVSIGEGDNGLSADIGAGRHVRVTVRDTGTGMSAEVRDRLFEPFFTTKGLAGTGLGLSVVHGIVRDHGGAITVESDPGRGTAFSIYLPAVAAEATTSSASTQPEKIRGSGQHVMYVDDDDTLVFLMSRVLERLGYRCATFTDAQTALQEFRTAPFAYDAVITDMHMPSMSGIELAAAVRRVRADVPIALASGNAAVGVSEASAAGVSAWIQKPSTLVEISQVLHGMMPPPAQRGRPA